MSALSIEDLQLNKEEIARESKKEKKHKHKKDKKHKRHKERHRSTLSREREGLGNAGSPANRAEPTLAPNGNSRQPIDHSGTQWEALKAVSRANSGTPESGEISGKEPETDENSKGVGSSEAKLSKKRTAEKEEAEGVSPKRLRTENGEQREASQGREGAGTEDPVKEAIEEDSIRDGAELTSQHTGRQDGDKAATDGETSRQKERHRSASRPGEKVSSRSRPPSRERGRGDGLAERSHGHEERSERHRNGSRHRDSHRSRERGREDRRLDDRNFGRSYHRADSRSRRDESRSRRDYSRGRRDDSRSRRDQDGKDRSNRRHESERKRKSREKEDKEFAAKVIAKLEENEVDEDELIEQRRRKRQELMAKLQQEKEAAAAVANPTASEKKENAASLVKAEATPEPKEGAASEMRGVGLTPITSPLQQAASSTQAMSPRCQASAPPSPAIAPSEEAEQSEKARVDSGDSGTEDEHGLDEGDETTLFQNRRPGHTPEKTSEQEDNSPSEERHKIAMQKKKAQEEFDMFSADKVEDMFGDAPVGAPEPLQNAPRRGLVDNYDDSEGYYNFQVGEIMNERFEVFATHGKGVFSTVLRARDRKPVTEKGEPIPVVGMAYPEVAIKVIRANDIMSKAGQTEVVILKKLAGADPTGKYHIIRLLGTFHYRNHLCLVFEPLESNLRQLTKKYGQGIGLRLDAVRSMAAQMLMALHLMKQCGVLHADIKPDNILINRGHNVVKMCDFGSAMFMGNNEITPYLVSRFYRAPEVILGLHYDHPMDVWSIGCVIYELFTGRILFPGRSNNEMLKLMMDIKGPFPKKMLKKGEFALQHFEDDPAMSFCLMEMDPLTKRPTKRLVPNPTIKKDFRGHLAGQEGDSRQISNLIDLLEKMMNLDPDKRMTAKEALRHPFIKDGRIQIPRR